MAAPVDLSDRRYASIVVGGGVTGCFAALQLAKLHPPGEVLLLEREARLGGRLLSIEVAPDGFRLDLGAMRYRTLQTRTRTLIEDVLEMSADPLPLGASERLFHLRGRRLTDADFQAGDQRVIPYVLALPWNRMTPGQIVRGAIEQALGRPLDHLSVAEASRAAETARWNGQLLKNWDFWRLIHAVAGTEAYACAFDGAGIGNGVVGRWNAAAAVPWFLEEFRSDVTYKTVRGGFDHLTSALGAAFVGAGGRIALGTSVEAVRQGDHPGTTRIAVTARGARGLFELEANRVVLALPPAALRPILGASPAVTQAAGAAVDAVTAQGLMRLVLRYESAMLGDRRSQLKRLATDLPIRQVTFDVLGTASSGGPEYVLCSFNDVRYPHFWSTLREISPSGADYALDAASALVAEAHRQIVEALAVTDEALAPSHAWFVDWAEGTFGGGWHTWRAGVDPEEVMTTLRGPIGGLPLHIIGEAYSRDQAWVEGSLQSADDLLMALGAP